jgi:hypothetical protein
MRGVKITVQLQGGFGYFPGLAAPRVLDTAQLDARDAGRIRATLAEARFFDRPEPQPLALPDARTYTITVDDGTRERCLQFSDPLPDEHLETLVNLVRHLASAQRNAPNQ